MSRVLRRTAAAAAVLFGVMAACAQTVSGPFQLSTTVATNGESVVVVNPFNSSEVLVGWQWDDGIAYVLTNTGFASWTSPSALPLPNTDLPSGCITCTPTGPGGDPIAAASRVDGSLILGGLFAGIEGNSFGLARKPPGVLDFLRTTAGDVMVRFAVPCTGGNDRDSMAIGPRPPDLTNSNPESALITWYAPETGRLYTARSRDVAPVASSWELCPPANPDNNTGYPTLITSGPSHAPRSGIGAPAVILPGTPGVGRAGRLIVASCAGGTQSINPAEVTWSDTGGGPVVSGQEAPWAEREVLDGYGASNSPITGINGPGGVPVPADVRLQFKSAPSIAVDFHHSSEVYVAFTGRDANELGNVDVFIAWTDTATNTTPVPGPVFQSQSNSPDSHRATYRVDDSLLALPGELTSGTLLQQFLAQIWIDDLGGINLACYQARQDLDGQRQPTPISVRYARWPSRAALASGSAPFLWASREFTPWAAGTGNDYLGLTAADCRTYVTYASNQTGDWHIYVLKVNLPCTADVTADGVVDAADPVAFTNAYLIGASQADVNHDSTVDARDVTDFATAFSCGACALPGH